MIRVSGVEYDRMASKTSARIPDRISELEAKLKPEQDLFADKYNRGEVDPRTVEVRSPSLEEELASGWWEEREIMIDQLVREQQSAWDNEFGWDWDAFARTLCYRWVLEYAELIVPELGRLYWKAFGRKRYLREVR